MSTRSIFISLKIVCVLYLFAFQTNRATAVNNHEASFWYNEAASDWESAIPIGNGRIGGMIFGDPLKDQIIINENSIWCGPPVPPNNPKGPQLIAQMRQLIFAGEYSEAEALCENEFLDGVHECPRSYQPFGFLQMDYADAGAVTDYKRWLDYTKAVTYITYKQNGTTYTREAFVSAPAQVMVIRITADRPGKISFSSGFSRPFGATCTAKHGNSLYINGRACAENGEYQGVNFDGIIRFQAEGGKTKASENQIRVDNANSVTILIAISTDYNLHSPYNPLTHNREKACEKQLSQAIKKGFARLKQEHIADYTALYDRSTFHVDFNTPAPAAPIDRRITMAAQGNEDPELLLEYYRYCRYLLISSSRKGGLPMNLQGIWNPLMLAPWRSNFHTNINVQEAYWFAEQTNLADCHEPLFTLTENLVDNGKETARTMMGVRRGFVAGHRTDVWFYTGMTGAKPYHGMYTVSGGWLASHLMEHYRFTQDKEFLQERAYPVMREAALFFVDWLVPDPRSGKLVAGPSASAENSFIANGKRASLTMGASHDQEIVWNLFRDYLEACSILEINDDTTKEVEQSLKNLALPKISADGRLMEWPEDLEESEPGHRHLSHLCGMFPGNRITMEGTPYLAEAVRKSLNFRLANNYAAQGWSLGWVACLMARLDEGDRALNMMTHSYFNKAYPNMFVDAHGRVQVGDMMGVPLAMVELLLQSHTEYIDLLPALPSDWKEGKVTGLCARGGFVVDLTWENNRLESATLHSNNGGTCKVHYGNKVQELSTEAGKTYQIDL